MKVDLPAFGIPNKPTSANTFNSRRISRNSPLVPVVHLRGARLVDDLKCVFPKPPSPPPATRIFWPSSTKSPIISPESVSTIVVPTGTFKTTSSPPRPVQLAPAPFLPRSARNLRV